MEISTKRNAGRKNGLIKIWLVRKQVQNKKKFKQN